MFTNQQKAWVDSFLSKGTDGEAGAPPGSSGDDDGADQAGRTAGAGVKKALAGAGPGAGPATTDKSALSPGDLLGGIPGIIIGGVKTLTGELICNVTIQNNTDQTLTLDPSLRTKLPSGEIKGAMPKAKLGPNGDSTTFVAHSIGKTIPIIDVTVSVTGVDGTVKYLLADGKTVWTCRFENPRIITDPLGTNEATSTVVGPGKGAVQDPIHKADHGSEAAFTFILSGQGGGTPTPVPGGAAGTATSCLVSVVNQTKSTLFLRKADKASGDYMTQPASSLAPGATTQFAFVQTPNGKEPELRGLMTWDVGDPKTATWDLMFDNPTGGKNYTAGILKPDNTGLHSLDQIGQGDENVPVTFTLSGEGGGVVPPNPQTGGSSSCDITIVNNTQSTLSLTGRKTGSGAFTGDPPTKIAAGATVKVAYAGAPNSPGTGCVGALEYSIGDDAAAAWAIDWNNPPGQANTSNDIVAPASAGFQSSSSIGPGDDKVPVSFILSGGQPKPAQGGTKMTMTVANQSDQPLTLSAQSASRGKLATPAPTALAAGAIATVVADDGGDGKGTAGTMVWEVGAKGGPIWTVAWDETPGQDPQADGKVDPGDKGFKSDQAAKKEGATDGAATFTLSGGAAPAKDDAFAPPPKSKQPTLRLNDKSPDGWVEYAQRLLNKNNIKTTVDGDFGKTTQKNVIAFQKLKGLRAVDGVIGNETWSALREGPIEAVGTDGRKPHTFEEKGAQARFLIEQPEHSGFIVSENRYFNWVVSTGEQPIDKFKATVKVTQKDGTSHTHSFPLDGLTKPSPDGQGNFIQLSIPNFTQAYQLTNPAQVADCTVDAYLDQAIGGDRFTGPIPVIN